MSSDPALEQALEGHKGRVNSVAFGSDSLHMASGGEDGVVFLWNFRPGARAFRYKGHKVRRELVPPSRARPAVQTTTIPTPQGPVTDVAISPGLEYVASASADRTIRIWKPTV